MKASHIELFSCSSAVVHGWQRGTKVSPALLTSWHADCSFPAVDLSPAVSLFLLAWYHSLLLSFHPYKSMCMTCHIESVIFAVSFFLARLTIPALYRTSAKWNQIFFASQRTCMEIYISSLCLFVYEPMYHIYSGALQSCLLPWFFAHRPSHSPHKCGAPSSLPQWLYNLYIHC